jgi:hypothetical protein
LCRKRGKVRLKIVVAVTAVLLVSLFAGASWYFHVGTPSVTVHELEDIGDIKPKVKLTVQQFTEGQTANVGVELYMTSSRWQQTRLPQSLVFQVEANDLAIDPTFTPISEESVNKSLQSGKPLQFVFSVTAVSEGVKQLNLVLGGRVGDRVSGGSGFSQFLYVRPSVIHVAELAAAGSVVLAFVGWGLFERRRSLRLLDERIQRAEALARAEPAKAKFAWDVASVKLEAYFDRNLSQVNQIFYVSVTVMMVGFVFVLWAALLSLGQHAVTPTSKVAAIAGIVAQFIGATFMLIYRSTIAQATAFMLVLERINTVGMAVQVLDVMPP